MGDFLRRGRFVHLRFRDGGHSGYHLLIRGRAKEQNVTFYIDNSNARDALVKGRSKTVVINRAIQIFRGLVQEHGCSVWLELVPSGRNVADFPTRYAPIPSTCREFLPCGIIPKLKRWITTDANKKEFFP